MPNNNNMATNKDSSLLFLNLSGASGVATLAHAIPKQELILKSYNITWDTTGDSTAAGSLIFVQLGNSFSSNRINSNLHTITNDIPLLNDLSLRVTSMSPDTTISMDKLLHAKFHYKVVLPSGLDVANITDINLVFEYDKGSM
jgi:hypothetical protein